MSIALKVGLAILILLSNLDEASSFMNIADTNTILKNPQNNTFASDTDYCSEIIFNHFNRELGKIKHCYFYDLNFIITNNGDTDLYIEKIQSYCDCFKIIEFPALIKANTTALIKTQFDAAIKIGEIKKHANLLCKYHNREFIKTINIHAEIEKSDKTPANYYIGINNRK